MSLMIIIPQNIRIFLIVFIFAILFLKICSIRFLFAKGCVIGDFRMQKGGTHYASKNKICNLFRHICHFLIILSLQEFRRSDLPFFRNWNPLLYYVLYQRVLTYMEKRHDFFYSHGHSHRIVPSVNR